MRNASEKRGNVWLDSTHFYGHTKRVMKIRHYYISTIGYAFRGGNPCTP